MAESLCCSPETIRTLLTGCAGAQSLSRVQLFGIPWTITLQILLSMGYSRQEYWSGLPLPIPRHLPIPGIKPVTPVAPAPAGRSFTAKARGKQKNTKQTTSVLLAHNAFMKGKKKLLK